MLVLSDVIEGQRVLAIGLTELNNIKLEISGGRSYLKPGEFLLDSDDVDVLIEELIAMREAIRVARIHPQLESL